MAEFAILTLQSSAEEGFAGLNIRTEYSILREMESSRREIILQIGERLFSRNGYRDVSIDDITTEVGLGTGSFYTYFASKEAFYDEILDRIEQKGVAEARRIVGGFQSPLNKLKALYRFFTLGLRKSEILRGTLTRDPRYTFPGMAARKIRGSTLLTHIEGMLDELLLEGIQKNVFRCGAYKNPKRMLYLVCKSLLLELPGEEATEELVDDVLVLLEKGLKRRLRLRKRDERIDRRRSRRYETSNGGS